MKVGVICGLAAGPSYDEVLALARAAEEHGFESFWVPDHFFGGEGYPDRDCYEAWTVLAALSRDTRTIRLGCLVTATQYRNPALLAKIVASVDQLSGGRIEFGIGAGWKENEYKAYGYDFAPPGDRVDQMIDAIEICRRLWTEERATYQGRHYRVDEAVCAPKPVQRPHPPIWVGGAGPRVLRVAARLADGFDIGRRPPGGFLSEGEMRAACDELDQASRNAKRERRLLRSHWSTADAGDDAAVRALAERIDAYARAGLDRYILSFPRERAGAMIRRAGAEQLPKRASP
jgi:F420-dependent oxidoreductase-like protein